MPRTFCHLSPITGSLLVSVFPCNAQQPHPFAGWLLEVENRVTPSTPRTGIHIWAWFDYTPDLAELFGAGRFDLQATEPAFWSFTCVMRCGSPAPIQEPMRIRFLNPAQFHDPRFPGDPSNPIAVIDAWWETTDFRPRHVRLSTTTWHFGTYKNMNRSTSYLFPLKYVVEGEAVIEVGPDCRPDCDSSTGVGVLDIFDFLCFQNLYELGNLYACDCDTSTGPGVCDIFDFLCFQNAYSAGCP